MYARFGGHRRSKPGLAPNSTAVPSRQSRSVLGIFAQSNQQLDPRANARDRVRGERCRNIVRAGPIRGMDRPQPGLIVGLGSCGVDTLAHVQRFPSPDEKIRTLSCLVRHG